MYSKIIVPLDGSELAEQVLPCVRLLAAGLKIPVELVRVIEPVSSDFIATRHVSYLGQGAVRMRVMGQKYLNKIEASLQGSGISVSCQMHEGDAAPQILAEGQRDQDAIIAMSTHGRSGIARWMLGSVADKVLRATTNPLLLVRSSEDGVAAQIEKLTTLIVPLDGSPEGEMVLPQVVSIAKGLHLKVMLVRSTPSMEEYHRTLEYHYEVDPGPIVTKVYEGPYEEFSEDVNAKAMEYLHEKVQEVRHQGLPSVEERLLHGNPAGSIVDLTGEIEGSLIAMTTHGRSGVGRWVLGSVADRVVRYAECPVLVVRATRETRGDKK